MEIDLKCVFIICCMVISIVSITGLLINRIYLKKGIGYRSLQFILVTVIVPLTMSLTVLKILPPSTISVIVGIIIGYAFSKLSRFDKKQKSEN